MAEAALGDTFDSMGGTSAAICASRALTSAPEASAASRAPYSSPA